MKEIKKYYPDGQIRQHCWKDKKGNYQGECKIWHHNEQLWQHCFYKNHHLEGECKIWYSSGQLMTRHFYKNGLKEGEDKSWYHNGQILEHCFYKNGLYEGEYKQWEEDGQKFEHLFFHNNNEIDITHYVADINNITEEEYFHLQLVFGYFPIINFNGTL